MQPKIIIGVVAILGLVGYLGVTGMAGNSTYYIEVTELLEDKGQWLDKRVRVRGFAEDVDRQQSTPEFTLSLSGASVPVIYTGNSALPDTFKNHAETVATGKLRSDGTFEAEEIQAKCASKYEKELPPDLEVAPAGAGVEKV